MSIYALPAVWDAFDWSAGQTDDTATRCDWSARLLLGVSQFDRRTANQLDVVFVFRCRRDATLLTTINYKIEV